MKKTSRARKSIAVESRSQILLRESGKQMLWIDTSRPLRKMQLLLDFTLPNVPLLTRYL